MPVYGLGLMSAIHLPERCGVMILPDCSLFPHGGLPLRIFEPRYREMLNEALEGDCFFAVARLVGDESEGFTQCASGVGTIGLVRASHEQDDGTSQLLLHGVMRVKFLQWHEDKSYPSATIEPLVSKFEPEDHADAAMTILRGAVEDAVVGLSEEVQSSVFELLDRADDPALMSDIVSQQFVHDADLRQELLESTSVGERISKICDYLRKISASA